jgi:hypothetical protein
LQLAPQLRQVDRVPHVVPDRGHQVGGLSEPDRHAVIARLEFG